MPFINVYLTTRKETEKLLKIQISVIKKIEMEMGGKIEMEMRFQSSLWILFLISAFSLWALKIKNWRHLILNLLIDIQFIFFWKISVVGALV